MGAAAADIIMPLLAMVVVQTGYAGMSLISKLALNGGMKPVVFVTYRQIFAAFATFPFAFFFERKTRPRITIPIMFQIFLCSTTGFSGPHLPYLSAMHIACRLGRTFMNQIFFFIGLSYSTPTIACAVTNIIPALTFIFAAVFRQESVGIKTRVGQAKVVGTVVCVGGATLLTFYHGHPLNVVGVSSIHWKFAEKITNNNATKKANFLLGPLFLIASSASLALWFVIQSRLSKQFSAPYTTTTLMCLMASIQSAVLGACFVHDLSAWSLRSGIRIFSTLYAAVVCTALSLSIMSWCIHRKGPLYVSVFSPLSLVITAIFSWVLLQEKLYLGTLLGAILIILGLYSVLWGKDKEAKAKQVKHIAQEPQLNGPPNNGIGP